MKLSINKQIEKLKYDQNLQRNVELIVSIGLILVIIVFVIRPTVSGIISMYQGKEEVDLLLVDLEAKRQDLEQAESLVDNIDEELSLYEDAYPNQPKQFDLLNTLRIVAENEGIILEELLHTFDVEGTVSFTITGGGTYEDITRYVEALEKVPRLISVTQVTLAQNDVADEQNSEPITVSISGVGYYYEHQLDLLNQ